MILNLFRNSSKQKSRPSPRRHGTAARRKLFCPKLELLEGRITPATHSWIGGGPDPLWTTPANWIGGAPGGDSNARVIFFGGSFAGGHQQL
jgi:hypothetical protein